MENNLLFSDKFNSTTKNEITDIIARESFFSMERAIDPKIVDKILAINKSRSRIVKLHPRHIQNNMNTMRRKMYK